MDPVTEPDAKRPEPSDSEKAHVATLKKLIDAALDREKIRFVQFERQRKSFAGFRKGSTEKKYRANLIYAAIAATLPQVYAKNPDISFSPTEAVGVKEYEKVKKFGQTGEIVLRAQLKEAQLKRRAKAITRSTMTTGIGWWKVSFQETKAVDPLIINRMNDTQDNLDSIESLSAQVKEDATGEVAESKQQELKHEIAALQETPELAVARGLVLDNVLAEDVIVLDRSVRNFDEYVNADKITHRLWLSKDKYQETFKYKPEKARIYAELKPDATSAVDAKNDGYYCVFETWDKGANTVYTTCDGEPGYCRAPFVPQKVGKRWYPFFALGFNVADGSFYPLSDVDLLEDLVEEYNDTRDALAKDRKSNLPVRIAKGGGNLTDEDFKKIQARESGDIVVVNGTPGKPLSEDIENLSNPALDPMLYDTQPIRSDMERIIGGGDAAQGSILKAKTATEAEIMAQGLQSRTGERQDTIEDFLADVADYATEILLNELSLEEVQRIAGLEAVWPELAKEDIFNLVRIEIKAGTTGKPNRRQEQETWIQLMPMIKEGMTAIVELRQTGQFDMADAVKELIKESLRRFDERLDLDMFIPPAAEEKEFVDMSPEDLRAALIQANFQNQEMAKQLEETTAMATDEVAKEDAKARRAVETHRATKELDADPALLAAQPPIAPPAAPAMPDPAQTLGPMLNDLATRLDGLAMLVQQMGSQPQQPPVINIAPPAVTVNNLPPSGQKQISIAAPSGQTYSGTVTEGA